MTDPKDTLQRYLQSHREAIVWKLDGLDERAARWPMTPTGTNLLGLVKHLANVELGYFGDTFGRPHGETLTWYDDQAGDNDDLWATAEESREDVVAFYRRAWAHSDATVAALELESPGQVPWWPAERRDVTLHQILVHVVAETARHAGHADIVRELSDGQAGLRAGNTNLPEEDGQWWADHVARLRAVAEQFPAAEG
jgi:uncharacterized damage-inducible protein DinB